MIEDPFSGLRPWQKPHVQHLLKVLLKNGSALDASDTGCHAKGTPILMFDGQIKKVEDIVVGDQLMGWDSTSRAVLRLCRGREEMVRVVPVKGDSFVVNRSHILSLVRTNVSNSPKLNGAFVDVSVKDWERWAPTWRHQYKQFRVPVTAWRRRQLPVPPYHLGMILGDGSLRRSLDFQVCKPDPEIFDACRELAGMFGAWAKRHASKGRCDTIKFLRHEALWFALGETGVIGCMSEDKFIPYEYKTGSEQQRRELLAGLLDTDGHRVHSGGGFDFISKSPQLSEDLAFVARSLGFAAYVKPSEKYCQTGAGGIYWRVSLSGDFSVIPLRIARKKSPPRMQIKSVLRTGFHIEHLPEDDFYGFTLNGDGRFLMGDFTVTHNTGKTYAALNIAKIMGVTPFVMGPKGAKAEWIDAGKLLNVPVEFNHYDIVRRSDRGFGIEKPWGSGSFWQWGIKKELMIFDECHKCGGSTTITGKLLRAAPKAAEFTLCLSATAADNPKHLKNLGVVLGLFQNKDYYHWLMRNGCPPDYTGRPTFSDDPEKQKAALLKIHKQIFPCRGARMRRSEIPGFPETLIDTRIYETAVRIVGTGDTLAERTSQRQEAEKALVQCLMPDIEDALENENKVVVFLNYTAPLDEGVARSQKQGWTTELVDGRQSGDKGDIERARIKKAFQNNEIDVLFVNNQAGGAGLSLHDPSGKVERTAFISPAETGRQMKQVVGRVHRDGGAFSRQYFCGIRGTIQEQILLTNRKKLQNIDTLNDAEADSIIFS